MKAYRIHEENGGFTFDDTEPRRACTYDIVNLRLPEGAVIFNFGEAPDVLCRIKLADNTYTHLETDQSQPFLVGEAIKNGVGLNTSDRILLEYVPVEENLRCDFECLATYHAPDNIYHLNYVDGKYWVDDLYERRIVSKQEAMRCKAAWG